jgi:DNA-binding protein HU-beta
VTKAEIITLISSNTGIDKDVVSITLEGYFDAVKDTLLKGDGVFVRGFGSFVNKKRASKKARNLATNTTVMVEEHYIPCFKPAKEFTEQVKSSIKS